jgi:hypothetical protein
LKIIPSNKLQTSKEILILFEILLFYTNILAQFAFIMIDRLPFINFNTIRERRGLGGYGSEKGDFLDYK